MSAKQIISASNVAFLLAGVYFAALAGLGESTVYAVIATVICFISIALSYRKSWFFSGPWRVASSVFVLVLTVSQLISTSLAVAFSNVEIGSALINGAIFVVFLGVLLSTSREVAKTTTEREEKEAKKETKRITYEI